MAAVIEYAIRSKDQSQAGVKSAEGGVERLKKSVEGFSRILTGTFLGGASLMAIRQIVQFGEASIKAAKDAGLLTPELDKLTKQMQGLKAAIGVGLAEGLRSAFKVASEGIEILPQAKIATAVAGVIEKIGQAFKLLWDLVWTTGSGMFVRVFIFMGKVGLVAVEALYNAFKALFNQISLIWDNIAYDVKSVWAKVIDWMIDGINAVLALWNNSFLGKTIGGLGQLGKLNIDLGKKPASSDLSLVTKPISDAFKKIETLGEEFGKDVVDSWKNLYNDVLALFSPPSNIAMPNKPTAPGMPPPGYGNMPTFGAGYAKERKGATGATKDSITMLMDVLGGVFDFFSANLKSVSMLLQPLQTIFSAMFAVLAPVVDSVLAPLVGILTILGRAMGAILIPIVTALTPVIEIVAQAFVFLYNYAIMPLANGIIFAVNMIYNLLTGIWNVIASAINAVLGWAGVHLNTIAARAWNEGFLTAISMEDLTKAGTETTAAAGGAGATYTAAPIYNIYITNNFEAGSVIDSSGTWQRFIERVWNDGTLLEAARQGA